jgi:hypothetical protein
MGRPPIGTHAMTGAQRQRRYLAKRTRTQPAATPVATTTASVIELAQLQAQLEKLQRDTQDEAPLPGGVGVNVKCLRLCPVEVFLPGSTRRRGPACNPGRRRSGARRSESPRHPSVVAPHSLGIAVSSSYVPLHQFVRFRELRDMHAASVGGAPKRIIGVEDLVEAEPMRDQAGQVDLLRLHRFQEHRRRNRVDRAGRDGDVLRPEPRSRGCSQPAAPRRPGA